MPSPTLPRLGIEPVILTGRTSRIVEQRAAELGIRRLYQGVSDKAVRLADIAAESGVSFQEIACIGDDLNDLPACAFAAWLPALPMRWKPYARKQTMCAVLRAAGRRAGIH